jgi:DNA-binding NarL/FixJ family response regulator
VVLPIRRGECPTCGGTGEVDTTYGLSPTEILILNEVAHGFTLKETAHLVGRSYQTVKNHMASVYKKLQVHNLQEAVYMLWLKEHLGERSQSLPLWP